MLRSLLILSCLLSFAWTNAQNRLPAIEREVSLRVSDEPVSAVLTKITAQTGINFSYSPSTVPVDKKVSITVHRKPVRTVLRLLLGAEILMREKGEYIILTAKQQSAVQAHVKQVTISGYVYDNKGDKLVSASIVSKTEKISAVTNRYGYYKMEVPADKLPLALKVEKENYPDTSFQVKKDAVDVDVVLPRSGKEEVSAPVADSTAAAEKPVTRDSTDHSDKNFLGGFMLSDETKANIRNVKDTIFSNVQISLLPFISTNKLLTGNTVNSVSVNILAGYSRGVKIAEIGGLVNVDRGDVKYFQAAGWMNAVSGNVEGLQVAGGANLNSGRGEGVRIAGAVNMGNHMKGVQIGGLMNMNADYRSGIKCFGGFLNDTVDGLSIAGLVNMNAGQMNGVRIGGLSNIGNGMDGMQIAGLFNANGGHTDGVQIAGLFNANHGRMDGFQLAGLFNVTCDSSEGPEMAGLMNINFRHLSGLQLTSILNYARSIDGVQIGLVNISGGGDVLPVGLLSFSNKGYHKIELSGDDVLYTQLAFRTGVTKFHNIFLAGVDLTTRVDGLWGFGYGFGSTLPLTEKWSLTGELTSQVLLIRDDIEDAPQLGNLGILFERSFGKRFSIAAGPVYRVLITENAKESGPAISDHIVPYSFYDHTTAQGSNIRMWVGGKLSLKFL